MSSDAEKTAISYSDEAVALLDIIGFKDKVEKTKTNPSLIAEITDALSSAQEWLTGLKGEAEDIYIQTFSDTTLVCCSNPDPLTLASLAAAISLYQCSMVLKGNVLRGGLAVGPNLRLQAWYLGPLS